jgi:hypothetical protein
MIKMQRVFRTIPRKDAVRWLDWSKGSQGTIIDAIKDPHDELPAFVDVAQYLLHSLRHPRAFIRQHGLERVGAKAEVQFGKKVADELSH